MPFRFLLALSLLLNHVDRAAAQSAVYKPFEVDSVASPRGGQSMLETFLAANLQKPFLAKVANVTGKVFVTAVVETNGYVSDVQIMRSLRPDCDQEALRAMRLFNAWKPAQKAGVPVRQLVTYPVVFQANEPLTYAAGKLIEFFDGNQRPTTDSRKARFQQTTAIDSITGLPNGELVLSEIKSSGKLRELVRLSFARVENKPTGAGEPITYTMGHKHADGTWYGYVYTVDGTNRLRNRHQKITGETTTYGPDGLVTFRQTADRSHYHWQPNGLLKQIELFDKTINQLAGESPYRTTSVWDSMATPLVVDGHGQASLTSKVMSRSVDTQEVDFVEWGSWVNGLKHGVWKGAYSDGSYSYEESFENGKPLGGSAIINKTKTITYTASQQNPEFEGGMKEMYAFLAQNIRYPADAARNGIQGKVFMAFTVCTDGTLCDFELLQGVDRSLDAEAARVVKASSGRWQPGSVRGEPVRVKYNIPISFQMATTSTMYR
ncbi:TonB family protein [Fibrella arboris]|uniref:TonB family protein n=1 Tax=Fibrella arboris TaxID=3242486 RepID=UPI003521068A